MDRKNKDDLVLFNPLLTMLSIYFVFFHDSYQTVLTNPVINNYSPF